jgi:hypothetical protein
MGKVNYFWGGCEPNHLHIVWQRGDELRQSCVQPYNMRVSHYLHMASFLEQMSVPAASRLIVNVGHDLNLDNLQPLVAALPPIAEASIGHELTADALEIESARQLLPTKLPSAARSCLALIPESSDPSTCACR